MGTITDYRGTEVEKVVKPRVFSSDDSFEEADELAINDIAENGQQYANDNGECEPYRWWNEEETRTLIRNNCADGYFGSDVSVTLPERTLSSYEPETDFTEMINNWFSTEGQEIANSSGSCATKNIIFEDAETQRIASNYWGSGGNVTYVQALAVTSLPDLSSNTTNSYFTQSSIISFDEFQYFRNVTSIGNYSFHTCPYLKSIKLPSSLVKFGVGVFNRCYSLVSIEIPASMTTWNGDTFYNSTSLKTVIMHPITPPIISGSYNFGYNDSSLKIYVPDESVTAYKTATNWVTWASKIYPMSELT